jgi:hypothetical protein
MRQMAKDAAAAMLLCGTAVLFWKLRIIDPGTRDFTILSNSDWYLEGYPMWYRASSWLREGMLPLWNPFQLCGQPLLATLVYGMLYPLDFPFLLLPTATAIEATTVLHFVAAGLFMYLYARTLTLSRLASTGAALAFMLSGCFVAEANVWISSAAAAVWIPLQLTAVERILAGRGASSVVLLAVGIGMTFLSGWAQTFLYSVYVVVTYTTVRCSSMILQGESCWKAARAGALVATGMIGGLCFAAPQLLPSMELQSLGPRRPGGITLGQMLIFPPAPLKELVAQTVASTPGRARPFYLGMQIFLLAPLSLFARSHRARVLCFWALATFAFAVALTVYTPVFGLYLMLPGATWFRSPSRMLIVYSLSGAALTGFGLEALGRLGRETPMRRVAAIATAGLIAAVVCTAIGVSLLSGTYLVLGFVLLLCLAWTQNQRVRLVLTSAFILLLAADLFLAMRNDFQRPYHDESPFRQEGRVLDFIRQRQGLFRTYTREGLTLPALMAKQGTLQGIYAITDYDSLVVGRYDHFFQAITKGTAKRPDTWTFTGLLEVDPDRADLRLLSLLSVKYFMFPKVAMGMHVALREKGWRSVFQDVRSAEVVYENPAPVPRAYVAHRVLTAETEAAALEHVTESSFDPWQSVVLEVDRGSRDPATEGPPITVGQVTSYEPTRVVIEADDPSGGYLVLTDTFYPGWRAYVDGRAEEIYRANYLFRGVHVPPGRHTVVFVYDPLTFKAGLVLCALAAATSIGAVLRPTLVRSVSGWFHPQCAGR